jgi:UDP-N-acetylmuramoyl-L-alanyl-D-glutamate--2,6-diaminopimelate ligase
MERRMKLRKLIQDIQFADVKGSKEIEITGICADSRIASPGSLFIARRGSAADGNLFMEQAVSSGASAIVTEIFNPFLGKATQLIHEKPQELEAILADRFFRHPSQELFVCGITGTNGKTTTTYLVKHLLDAMRCPCALLSTVETILGEKRSFSTLTTHDAITNQKSLRESLDHGCQAVSLEVSSHGLMQGRIDCIDLDAAIFTNLTPDHLDYHRTMEEYAAAKRRLFLQLSSSPKPHRCAIANGDDPFCRTLLEGCTASKLLFGLGETADVRAENISFAPEGSVFTVRYRGEAQVFRTTLIGRFNVYNILGVIALGIHRGYSLKDMARIFADFHTAPGRLERVPNQRGIHVFVDYAHTGDALENVLSTLREIARG